MRPGECGNCGAGSWWMPQTGHARWCADLVLEERPAHYPLTPKACMSVYLVVPADAPSRQAVT